MEVLRTFLAGSSRTEQGERICNEILGLLTLWDAYRDHTHEGYFYRWVFREKSIIGIRRLRAYLRNEIKLALRLGHGQSPFADELKLLLVAIIEMQRHMRDIPFGTPDQFSEELTTHELNSRFAANNSAQR